MRIAKATPGERSALTIERFTVFSMQHSACLTSIGPALELLRRAIAALLQMYYSDLLREAFFAEGDIAGVSLRDYGARINVKARTRDARDLVRLWYQPFKHRNVLGGKDPATDGFVADELHPERGDRRGFKQRHRLWSY